MSTADGQTSSWVADLSAAARNLTKQGKAQDDFRSAVRRLCGLQVEFNDLALARRHLVELVRIDQQSRQATDGVGGNITAEAGLIGHALYLSAILLYVRATERRSNHKPKPAYADQYNKRLLSLHDEIFKLRDDALAHWGPGKDRSGRAHNAVAALIVMPVDEGSQAFATASRANYRAYVCNALSDLLEEAIVAAQRGIDAAQISLGRAVRQLMEADPDWVPPAFEDGKFFARARLGEVTPDGAPTNSWVPAQPDADALPLPMATRSPG